MSEEVEVDMSRRGGKEREYERIKGGENRGDDEVTTTKALVLVLRLKSVPQANAPAATTAIIQIFLETNG